ncbi:hypothetical protein HYPBUDRAFT_204783 [Hyphopichia burtonii NRRL Y-1933]|uniref:Uncharacterized protein n=1 Tax=Hyphopichia burtonii NRRL Y-1933 TaxID=984485 RepID=A0A1E4RHX4_9ASCO|nr:hypothetical protein HYPBUDRAFT_204783 [Hyphopichia burtonii NRRL Y-1933]ODV66859.1 hypothetical protein HYPBUDRAFT_204783 [Hyphopichia burtonii NRRL Y-1933]
MTMLRGTLGTFGFFFSICWMSQFWCFPHHQFVLSSRWKQSKKSLKDIDSGRLIPKVTFFFFMKLNFRNCRSPLRPSNIGFHLLCFHFPGQVTTKQARLCILFIKLFDGSLGIGDSL